MTGRTYLKLIISSLLFIQMKVWSQNVILNKITIEPDSIVKMVEMGILINEIKLDSINRIKLLGTAFAYTKDAIIYTSDEFFNDDYLDNYDNTYNFVFDSIPNDITNFQKINGVLRYFYPSHKNKSIVSVSNSTGLFDSNILNQKSSDIKVMPINGFVLCKLKRRKKKLHEYIEKVSLKNRLNKNLFVKTLDKYFENYKKINGHKKLSNWILFYIEQPNYKVVSINIKDSYSKKRTGIYSVSTYFKLNGPESAIWTATNIGKQLEDKFNIDLVFENEGSISDFDFELLNVEIK